jgi:hypothetical protein
MNIETKVPLDKILIDMAAVWLFTPPYSTMQFLDEH